MKTIKTILIGLFVCTTGFSQIQDLDAERMFLKESIRLGGTVTYFYPDTLVNTQFVRDALSEVDVDSVLYSDESAIADSLRGFDPSQVQSDTANFALNVENALGNFTVADTLSVGVVSGGDSAEVVQYGYLYNWFVTDSIANTGWRVPTDPDWDTLTTHLGTDAGAKLAGGFDLWTDGALRNNTNFGLTGFDALPGGIRSFIDGSFFNEGIEIKWWSATQNSISPANAEYSYLGYSGADLYSDFELKEAGYSLRLLRDSTSTETGMSDGTIIPNDYTGNDGKIYDGVKIGTQVWITANLAETKYNTGADITEVTDNSTWAALTAGARCSYDNLESNAFTQAAPTITLLHPTYITSVADSNKLITQAELDGATVDSARAAATAEGSQGNFTANGDVTADNLISLGNITATWNIEGDVITATTAVETPELRMNGDTAIGIAGSSELDALFRSLTFSDTTEVWGYKQLFQADNGRVYGMIEPHVFLYNPIDPAGVTQEIGITWEQFLPGDTSFFEFAGLQNMDSVGNDTIGVQFSGHYWINGNIVISGSTGRTIDIRLFNITKAEPIKSGGSVTAQGTGNRMSLTMDGYCENCHADDKVIIQMQADQVTTFIFYSGRISIKGNHGFE